MARNHDVKAPAEHPIHDLIAARWSPYGFDSCPVKEEDLTALFEAARWAPSSFNEQPWSYIVARQSQEEGFQRLLSCLVEGNQAWAKAAPVLVLSVVKLRFERNGKINRAAIHDLGLATAGLVLAATARQLFVHQMVGIVPEKARQLYHVPEGYDPFTAIAIGYRAAPERIPEEMRQRDRARRGRKPIRDFVFQDSWGNPSDLVFRSKAR